MTTDRFELEERISSILNIDNDIDDLIFLIGDSKERPTEDQLLNSLIGIKSSLDIKYKRLWHTFEQLVNDGTIKNPTT
jgi:hypothetical protein